MEPTSSYRPRISRETRLLLTAGLLAITVLWLLARVRFRDRPVPPSSIPAVLSQLTTRPTFDGMAADVGALATRLAPSLVSIEWPSTGPADPAHPGRIAGLRLRDDLAVAQLPAPSRPDAAGAVAVDRASGLAVLRVPGQAPRTSLAHWAPREGQGPRYLMATDVSAAGVSLRPAFMGSFAGLATPLWTDPVWPVPADSDLSPGSLLFTIDAELVGLVILYGGQRAVVPAPTLLAEAERLLASPRRPAGTLGIEVQPLTPAVASATGASTGVVVTWVDPSGAAQSGAAPWRPRVGDVIEFIDGRRVTSRADWDVRMARLSAGDRVGVRGRSRGSALEASLVAGPAAPTGTRAIGLGLRSRPGTGAEVIRLQPGSAAERAGLLVGDVITVCGELVAPTPGQVTRAFAAMPAGTHAIVGFTRGQARLVTALER